MSAPRPSLTLFAFTHASSAETLAPSTIVSAQLMGGMPGASGRRGSQQGILHRGDSDRDTAQPHCVTHSALRTH